MVSGKTLLLALILLTPMFLVSPVIAGNDDLNDKELGVEYNCDYAPPWADANNCDDNALGFYNWLGSHGFTKQWNNGDTNASERHFEMWGVNGTDYDWVDNVDFVYFAGHGTTDGLIFRSDTDGDGYDTQIAHYNEMYLGDTDLEWLFAMACDVLYRDWWWWTPVRWQAVFNDLHGITGYASTAYDYATTGEAFAKYLTGDMGESVKCIGDAWKAATILTQEMPDVVGAVYCICDVDPGSGSIVLNYYDEYVPGYGNGMYNDPSEVVFSRQWYYET